MNADGKQTLSRKRLMDAIIRPAGLLRKIQADLTSARARMAAGSALAPEAFAKWAEHVEAQIDKLFQEIDMGQVATVINGLLSQITTLNGQLATEQQQLTAAQANSLDTSDQAALAAGQNELAAFDASQAPAPAAPAQTGN